ncbi:MULTISPECIES: hypothetical protein [unclassified Pseudomonas]|uniref:hypothetical protein n=1 Tax=unclassified Pseudomonas TaxID=196821 RepID=UPI0011144F98|nr:MULTISPECIES: hypothetical protein [unclassified Pseudomonas]
MKIDKSLVKAILCSWFVFFSAMFSPLIEPNYESVGIGYCLYFFCSYLVFYISMVVVDMPADNKRRDAGVSIFFQLFIFFLLLTFLFRVVDRFYFRPVDNYFSIESYREARKAGTNIFSFLGSFLLPFFFVSMDAYLQRAKSLAGMKIKIVPMIMVALIFFDLLASGSRGVVLVALVMLLGRYFSFKKFIFVLPVLVLLSGLLFVFRFISLAGREVDMQSMLVSVSSLGYAFFVPYSGWIDTLAGEGNALLVIFPFLQANQYLAHGFFEFSYMFGSFDGWFSDVVIVLPHFAKFLDQTQEVIRPGMYYTMAGTAYNAFGYFSIAFMMFLGMVYGVVLRSARFLGVGSMLVVLLSIFLLPFVNSFGGFDFYLYFVAILVLRAVAGLCSHGARTSRQEGL